MDNIKSASGTKAFIGVFADSVDVTALTNAAEAVATAAGHGLAEGDYVQISSGWGDITGAVVRVKAVAGDDVTLGGVDTQGDDFPDGAGIGSLRKVETRVEIYSVLENSKSGGEQQTTNYKLLRERKERALLTSRSAETMNLTLAFQPSRVEYGTLETLSKSGSDAALFVQTPGPDALLLPMPVTVSMGGIPDFPQDGAPIVIPVDFAIQRDPLVRYAA